jgi:hypothetical protein
MTKKKAVKKKAVKKKAVKKKAVKTAANEEEQTAAQQAVQRFEEADSSLREFMTDNPAFMDELRKRVEDFNASITEASNSVKAELRSSDRKRLVIGSFGAVMKRSERWDGNILAATLPAKVSQHFLKEIITYEVNVDKLEQMIRHAEVDPTEANKGLIHGKPSPAMIPGCPKGLTI